MAQLEREPPAKTDDLTSILETRVLVEVNQLPQAILTCTLGPAKDEINKLLPSPNTNKVKMKISKKKKSEGLKKKDQTVLVIMSDFLKQLRKLSGLDGGGTHL